MNLFGFLGKSGRQRRALGLGEKLRTINRTELMSQLTSGVAHDLYNLIMVIDENCALLLEHDLPLHVYRSVQRIRTAAKHGSGFLDTLLGFARGDSPMESSTDVDAAIRNMEPLLLSVLKRDTQLKTDLGAQGCQINIGSLFLYQIVLNLVLNARDALHRAGEIRLSTTKISLVPNQLTGSKLRGGEYVVLEVSDNGCGIGVEDGLRIFEPFFSTKEKGKGSGLGLTIVNGIVANNGGEVQVTSAPGQGTTVHIFLPKAYPTIFAGGETQSNSRTRDEASLKRPRAQELPAVWRPDELAFSRTEG